MKTLTQAYWTEFVCSRYKENKDGINDDILTTSVKTDFPSSIYNLFSIDDLKTYYKQHRSNENIVAQNLMFP